MRINMKYCWLIWGVGMIAVMEMMITVIAEGGDCETDLRGLEIECLYYMHKGVPPLEDPNDRCCKVIQSANIPCVCTKLSRHVVFPPGGTIEDMLDWNKVLHCLNFCGKPLSPGTKCGHFTVPPGPPPK